MLLLGQPTSGNDAFVLDQSTVQIDASTTLAQYINGVYADIGDKADASALTALEATVTQQGDDIDANSTALTAVQSHVGDIAAGPINFLDDADWVATNGSFQQGGQSYGVTSYGFTPSVAGAFIEQAPVDPLSGFPYTFATDLYGRPGDTVTLELDWGSTSTTKTLTLAGAWTRYSVTGTAPVDELTVRMTANQNYPFSLRRSKL